MESWLIDLEIWNKIFYLSNLDNLIKEHIGQFKNIEYKNISEEYIYWKFKKLEENMISD